MGNVPAGLTGSFTNISRTHTHKSLRKTTHTFSLFSFCSFLFLWLKDDHKPKSLWRLTQSITAHKKKSECLSSPDFHPIKQAYYLLMRRLTGITAKMNTYWKRLWAQKILSKEDCAMLVMSKGHRLNAFIANEIIIYYFWPLKCWSLPP